MPGRQAKMDGWMTTKKVGRDDTRIRRDRAKAKQQNKRKRASPSNASKKKRARQYDSASEDDDDGSIDDFIVDDDEDDEEELEIDDNGDGDSDGSDYGKENKLGSGRGSMKGARSRTTRSVRQKFLNEKMEQKQALREQKKMESKRKKRNDYGGHQDSDIEAVSTTNGTGSELKATMRAAYPDADLPTDSSSSSSSDSDEGEMAHTFLPMNQPVRRTKASMALKHGSIRATQGARAKPAQRPKPKTTTMKKKMLDNIGATEAVRKRIAGNGSARIKSANRTYLNIDSDSDSDDAGGYLTSPSPLVKKRSANSKLKANGNATSSKHFAKDINKSLSPMMDDAKTKRRFVSSNSSSSSINSNSNNNEKKGQKAGIIDLSQFAAPSSNIKVASLANKRKQKATKRHILDDSNHNDNNDNDGDDNDDDDDDDDVIVVKQTSKNWKVNGNGNGVSKSATTKRPKRRVIQNDSSDDDDDIEMQEAKRRSLGKKPVHMFALDDSDSDDDDNLAMKMAIKASAKEAEKQSKKKSQQKQSKSRIQLDEEESDHILLETSDEDNNDEDDVDAYDEGKEAAMSVLETAEQLSAQVLRAMQRWTDLNGDAGAKKGSAPQGMIVDGALALSTMRKAEESQTQSQSDASNKQDSDGTQQNRWISQRTMRKICPDVKLSEYQLIGVNWMALLHGMKCSIEGKRDTNVNGIMADEMGLGKTVQTITFLAWLKQHQIETKARRLVHVIVVPVSVMDNWMREFKTFCPKFNVIKFHGSMAEREQIREDLRRFTPTGTYKGQTIDALLCPMTFFQTEKSQDRKFLMRFNFDYMVCDEAHLLKNAQSTRYRMLNRIKTRHRLLLTGTPVQNSPQELLNMLCFIMPLFSRAGDSSAGDGFDDSGGASASEQMLQHLVDQKSQEGNEIVAYRKLKQLFAPFVLRRKKDEVLAQLIPPKKKVLELVDLDPAGRDIYDSILASHVDKKGAKLSAAIGEHLFTNLRKAAHHPLLLRTRHNTPAEVNDLVNNFHKYGAFKGSGSTKARVTDELAKFSDFDIHLTALELIHENEHRRADLDRYILDESAMFSSAKCARLRTLLPNLIADGHRVLIFSVWTTCLDLLSCLLENSGIKYVRMDGSCPSDMRQQLIDKFNQDDSISVFLLSTKACGVGINLTAADTCIIHDLDFNPFNDLQAEDRCHRIGQKRPVTIYKLVARGTVDEDIYRMQERKSKMNAAIMDTNTAAENKKQRKQILQSAIEGYKSPTKKSVTGDDAIEID